jgi:toxin FitB
LLRPSAADLRGWAELTWKYRRADPFAIPASGDGSVTIIDTNVISEIMASSPSEATLAWFAQARTADELFITTITVAEILYGVELLPPGKRRDRLNSEAEATFGQDFGGRILEFDEMAARQFAQIASSRRKAGRPIAEFDAQIAAIAHVHGAILATRNTSDFEGCGIRVVNPWVD